MTEEKLDFYSTTALKSYNLSASMRYQLAMLDQLDVFIRNHCENVANLTCRICEYMGLKEGFIIYATICAYLHDIGKLFIPSKILQKPGPLTEEEYEIMKTHTEIGYKMCYNDLKLRPYANGAKYHHESLDGSGYPNKLKGREIPLEAQIIKVADEFDAIASKRQYKTHINVSDTILILKDKVKNGKMAKEPFKALKMIIIDDTKIEILKLIDYINDLKLHVKELKHDKKNVKLYDEYMSVLEAKKILLNNLKTEIEKIKKL